MKKSKRILILSLAILIFGSVINNTVYSIGMNITEELEDIEDDIPTDEEIEKFLQIVNSDIKKRAIIADSMKLISWEDIENESSIEKIELEKFKDKLVYESKLKFQLKLTGGWNYEFFDTNLTGEEEDEKKAENLTNYGLRSIDDWSWLKWFKENNIPISLILESFTETDYFYLNKNGFYNGVENNIIYIYHEGLGRVYIDKLGSDIDLDFTKLFPKSIWAIEYIEGKQRLEIGTVGGRWPVLVEYNAEDTYENIVPRSKKIKDINGNIFNLELNTINYEKIILLNNGRYFVYKDAEVEDENDSYNFYYSIKNKRIYIDDDVNGVVAEPIALYALTEGTDLVKYNLDEDSEIKIIEEDGIKDKKLKVDKDKLKGKTFIWGGKRNIYDVNCNADIDKDIDEDNLDMILELTMWNLELYFESDEVDIILDGNGGKFLIDKTKKEKIKKGEKVNIENLEVPERKDYKFIGWYLDKIGDEKFDFNNPIERDITLYAKWEKIDNEENIEDKSIKSTRKKKNKLENQKPIYNNNDDIIDHSAYIFGYKDNTIKPEGNLTREEASAILDRVTPNKPMTRMIFRYPDVEENRWSYVNINNLSNKGGIKGYPDGNFLPSNNITRAEAATILVKLENKEWDIDKDLPKELKNYWASKELSIAINEGWLKGYEDGKIQPDKEITRAEFITLINRILDRKINEDNILEGIKKFEDLNKSEWYYKDIVEATNSHKLEKQRLKDNSEKWIEVIK